MSACSCNSVRRKSRKLRIDPDQCNGDQVYVTKAPYVFAMNKEGKACVVDQEGADEETIE